VLQLEDIGRALAFLNDCLHGVDLSCRCHATTFPAALRPRMGVRRTRPLVVAPTRHPAIFNC
jgi:hypothetical protein